ncbi:DegV family protein [Rhodococcus sp. AG1013]|uniref:DegV family protein n=1 Tax=unclassified Rhodococcus (in: high G+C Gram-positive bacteria) TaxID=192944 RepID=UPI000E0BA3B1|nr:DegV family protein [Rhodococcus sp. AG1013]RDI32334.1 DegV family protein with EDD domain [Rhodococcus sp. AG1013]
MPVVVVTDSSACLSPELVDRYGIRVVPLHLLSGGTDLRDGIDDVPDDLSGVTTSGASPGELGDAYAAALADSCGDGVVAVHISRQLSGTWEAGRQAAHKLGEMVRIVDSESTGMGLGYPALAAARVARAGGSLKSVYQRAVEVAARGRTSIVVDRLDHLRRGGRIGTAAALLGTALAMKPVLHLVDGKLVLREKTRTSTKALAKLVDAAVEQAGAERAAIAVHHSQAPERAEEIAAQLKERIPDVSELIVTEIGSVLGAHVGPGAIGIVVCPGGADAALPEHDSGPSSTADL